MGRSDYYKRGSWNAICDKCGFKFKSDDLRMQWDNLWVCGSCFDPKHPQYFVKSIPDDQTVPVARPDRVSASGTTTVKVAASKYDQTIDLNDTSNISDRDPINIVLDNGTEHNTIADGDPVGDTVTLLELMPYKASVDNTVYLLSVDNETYITATGVFATGL